MCVCGTLLSEAMHPHDWPPQGHLPESPAVLEHIPPTGPVAVASNTQWVYPPTISLGLGFGGDR
jgi:hypothetical protein